jgi:hypothetical protein
MRAPLLGNDELWYHIFLSHVWDTVRPWREEC